MPRYDYKCPEGHVTEETIPVDKVDLYDELDLIGCWCGRPSRRVFSAVPAIFRGGGWASKS